MRLRSRSLDFSPPSMATKWSLSGYGRTWLPPDNENKKSFAIRRDETNTEPLSRVNGIPCRNCAPGFIVFRLPMASNGKQKEGVEKREEERVGGKFFRCHLHVRFVRWTMRFKEVHVPLRFYLSYCKTNFPRWCFVAPSFIRHLVTCQSVSYVSTSSSCKNGQYFMFWLGSRARVLFVEFLQVLFYFIFN